MCRKQFLKQMIKYQNYNHFKLPITMNPLDYGKLIYKTENIFIIQINKSNITVITQFADFNKIILFREGNLMFEYIDHKIDEKSFIRSLENRKFTFKNNDLVSVNTEKFINRINLLSNNLINPINLINKLGVRNFSSINLQKIRNRKINWDTLSFKIENKVWGIELFEMIFAKFLSVVKPQFTEKNHMYILFKIKYNTNEIVTIGKLQRINKNDLQWYLNWIIDNMKIKSDDYNETEIIELLFSYGFKDQWINDKAKIKHDLKYQNFKNNKLPICFNPEDYGILIYKNENDFVLSNKGNIFKITRYENYNQVEMFSSDGKLLVKWVDKLISDNKFERVIDKSKLIFENNKQIFYIKEINTEFISKLKKSDILTNNIITLDIETYLDLNNTMIPCTISFYDGNTAWSFFLSDYESVDLFVKSALKSILKRKYNNYNVYIHNMARFDAVFLLKYLLQLGELKPLIRDNRIISLTLKFDGYKLIFKDSYQILLGSLSKLSKAFQIETPKTIFPYLFVKENNLDYIGEIPDITYFDKKITEKEYIDYKSKFNSFWNLKNEIIKYCEIDCISLFQILVKFNDLIFQYFNVNIHHYPTLPGLAFGIYRSRFMKEKSIPKLSRIISDNIRKGYTGGSVDMFIPEGKNLYCYDVNSLYPSRMRECLLPSGNFKKFEGDIRKINPQAFGFFFCKITAPENILHPILQTHVNTNNGIRTISPIGSWEDMIFSQELYNAEKFGYNFEILWGYTCDSDYLFTDYVDTFYKMRLNFPKSDPLNFIAKILMNSLYGRFGMRENLPEVIIMSKENFSEFEENNLEKIIDSKEINGFYLVTLINNGEESESLNINVGVASAITSYSRIHMTKFKNNSDFNLYYTDTDSIYIDKELNDKFVSSKELGKLKLECKIKKAVFLNAKLYCYLTRTGDIIKKVKGLKFTGDLTLVNFENLLKKDATLEKSQVKWKRSLTQGQIKLMEEIYTIQVNNNKRNLVYKNNKLIGTKAYKIDNSKDINK